MMISNDTQETMTKHRRYCEKKSKREYAKNRYWNMSEEYKQKNKKIWKRIQRKYV